MMDDLLLIVMRGGMTRAERTMLDFGRQDLVRDFRQSFENEMTQNLTGKIEQLTGRKVLTYQSQILFEPDIVAELFVFDKAADGGSAEIVATAEGQLRKRPHGEVRDDTGAATPAAPTDEPGSTPEQPEGGAMLIARVFWSGPRMRERRENAGRVDGCVASSSFRPARAQEEGENRSGLDAQRTRSTRPRRARRIRCSVGASRATLRRREPAVAGRRRAVARRRRPGAFRRRSDALRQRPGPR